MRCTLREDSALAHRVGGTARTLIRIELAFGQAYRVTLANAFLGLRVRRNMRDSPRLESSFRAHHARQRRTTDPSWHAPKPKPLPTGTESMFPK